jgi:hypothetical protein
MAAAGRVDPAFETLSFLFAGWTAGFVLVWEGL